MTTTDMLHVLIEGQKILQHGQEVLAQKHDELHITLTKIEHWHDELDKRLTVLESGQTEINKRLTVLEHGQDELHKKLTTLEQKHDELHMRLVTLEKKHDELHKGLQFLDQRQNELHSGLRFLQEELAMLREETATGFREIHKRLDMQGKQLAYVEDDTPTRKEYTALEKRVEKIEKVVSV